MPHECLPLFPTLPYMMQLWLIPAATVAADTDRRHAPHSRLRVSFMHACTPTLLTFESPVDHDSDDTRRALQCGKSRPSEHFMG